MLLLFFNTFLYLEPYAKYIFGKLINCFRVFKNGYVYWIQTYRLLWYFLCFIDKISSSDVLIRKRDSLTLIINETFFFLSASLNKKSFNNY